MNLKSLARRFGIGLLVICLCILAKACTVASTQTQVASAQGTATQTSVYDRVIQSSTIRAAYISYLPGGYKDPNTGQLSGIFVEAMEAAAKSLDLKVEWTEEVAWGTMIEGLLADRYDVVGTPVWDVPSRGKVVGFSIPLYYSGIGAYVRQDDNQFDGKIDSLNSKDVKIATIDGEMAEVIANSQFPDAQHVSLAQISDVSQMLLNVAENKSDVTFVEAYTGNKFLEKNPNSLKNLAAEQPIMVLGNSVMFKRNQTEFASMLNSALKNLVNSGTVDKLIAKYTPKPGLIYASARPYRTSAN